MRFFNFNTEDEMEFIDSKFLAYLMRLEKGHLSGSLDTYSLPRNDIGVVMINHKVPVSVNPISMRTNYKAVLGLVVPGKEYRERAKAYILTEEGGKTELSLWGEFNTPDQAVQELKAMYKAESLEEALKKVNHYRRGEKKSFEFCE